MNDIQDEAYTEACAEIERLKITVAYVQSNEYIRDLQSLLSRAADALEGWNYIDGHSVRDLHIDGLIEELRKAAQ